MTSEFTHYGHGLKPDLDNCGACCLTIPQIIHHGPNESRMGINYAAWPLSYIQNGRQIPERFYPFLLEELETDNLAYLKNLKAHLIKAGYDIEKIKNESED